MTLINLGVGQGSNSYAEPGSQGFNPVDADSRVYQAFPPADIKFANSMIAAHTPQPPCPRNSRERVRGIAMIPRNIVHESRLLPPSSSFINPENRELTWCLVTRKSLVQSFYIIFSAGESSSGRNNALFHRVTRSRHKCVIAMTRDKLALHSPFVRRDSPFFLY